MSKPSRFFNTPLKKFWWLFLYILVVENILVGIWAYSIHGRAVPREEEEAYNGWGVYSLAMLCSAAASLAGGLVGFLFGVPQENTRGQATQADPDAPGTGDAAAAGPQQAGSAGPDGGVVRSGRLKPNTNLERVSDGLTKALLGIGLSQIHNLPEWVRQVASFLGGVFGPGRGGEVVAVSVLAYGFLAATLFAYVTTRRYLSREFGDNDPA